MKEERIDLPKPEGQYCFACGTANPNGLDLHFYRSVETICTDITLGKYHVGWQNIAHGGIISTVLDEVMSWTVMYFKKTFFVTRKMEIKYVRPVFIGIPLTVTGRLLDDSKPPRIKVRADMRDNDKKLLVRSNGEFVIIPKDDLSLVPEGQREEMLSLFERFPDP